MAKTAQDHPTMPSEVTPEVSPFDQFATAAARFVSRAWFFALCVLLVVVWVPSYFVFRDVNTWQLIINTATTIVTFLLVALLQNTQTSSDEAAVPPGQRPYRRRARLPGPGHAPAGLDGGPGRRSVRAAAAGRRHGVRGHRARHRVRAGRRHRSGALVGTPRRADAGPATALRQHRPARDHQHDGVRPGDRTGLRAGRNRRRAPHAVRDRRAYRRGEGEPGGRAAQG